MEVIWFYRVEYAPSTLTRQNNIRCVPLSFPLGQLNGKAWNASGDCCEETSSNELLSNWTGTGKMYPKRKLYWSTTFPHQERLYHTWHWYLCYSFELSSSNIPLPFMLKLFCRMKLLSADSHLILFLEEESIFLVMLTSIFDRYCDEK